MRYLLFILVSIVAFGFSKKDPVHLFMIGDSTMANKKYEARPETGWGQVMQPFFNSQLIVSNHARNGRSSKSFIGEGLWKEVLDSLQKGDFVIIQFGHNDEKPDSARHTDPETTYKANLRKYINETRAKGAHPVLCTSIVRRKFGEDGKLQETHGKYPQAAREVAEEMNVPLIDLQQMTYKLISDLGPEESTKLYMHVKPGEFPNRPNGVTDDTHLRPEGAKKIAALAVEAIKDQNLKLAKFLR